VTFLFKQISLRKGIYLLDNITKKYTRKRAVLFIRRSLEDKKISTEFQLKMCKDFSIQQGFEIIDTIIEEKSAYNLKIDQRPEMQKLLNMVMDKKVDFVVAWQKGRLIRDVYDHIVLGSALKEGNCKALFSDPGEPQWNMDDETDRLIQIITTWRDEAEVEKLRRRIKAHLRKRAENGVYVGGFYYGYRWNKDRKKMEQVEEEVNVVKLIFKLYLYEGKTARTIANILNEKGYKTKEKKRFFQATITTILKNKIYCGYYRWGFTTSRRREDPITCEGYENKVTWLKPVITLEEWKKAQQILSYRTKKPVGTKTRQIPTSAFLLSGKVFCGECGKLLASHNGSSTYQIKNGEKKLTEHYKYVCRDLEPHSIRKRHDSKLIDFLVIQGVVERIKSINRTSLQQKAQAKLLELSKELNKSRISYKRKYDQCLTSIDNLMVNIERTTNRDMVQIYEERVAERREEVNELVKAIHSTQQRENELKISEEMLDEFMERLSDLTNYETFSQEKRKLYIEDTVEKVIVDSDNLYVYLKWNTPEQVPFYTSTITIPNSI
jgi:site-specific DNA recombinase